MPKITTITSIPLAGEGLRHQPVVEAWTNRKNNELGDNLALLNASDAARIRKRLRTLGTTLDAQHIFFEVVVGAFLARRNMAARYEFELNGQTPDWFVQQPAAIFEVVNIDPAASVISGMRNKPTFSFLCERVQQLWNALQHKATKYAELVKSLEIPYVIAVCPSFAASIEAEDYLDVLGHEDYGIFPDAKHVSGCLCYESMRFQYIPNPDAERPWDWSLATAENQT